MAAAQGSFTAGAYLGTLKNDGVQLDAGGFKVPRALRSKVATARAGVIAGTISVNPNKYPVVK